MAQRGVKIQVFVAEECDVWVQDAAERMTGGNKARLVRDALEHYIGKPMYVEGRPKKKLGRPPKRIMEQAS